MAVSAAEMFILVVSGFKSVLSATAIKTKLCSLDLKGELKLCSTFKKKPSDHELQAKCAPDSQEQYQQQAAASELKRNDRVERGVSTNFGSWFGKGSAELLRNGQNGGLTIGGGGSKTHHYIQDCQDGAK